MEQGNFQIHLTISSICFLFLNKLWESNFVTSWLVASGILFDIMKDNQLPTINLSLTTSSVNRHDNIRVCAYCAAWPHGDYKNTVF